MLSYARSRYSDLCSRHKAEGTGKHPSELWGVCQRSVSPMVLRQIGPNRWEVVHRHLGEDSASTGRAKRRRLKAAARRARMPLKAFLRLGAA